MAQCLQTYDEFIKNTFSPQIAVISGADCDSICAKNNLTLVELLQPFSRLNAEISVRDPAGYAYTVSNLKLGFKDTVTPPPQPNQAKKFLADVVSRTHSPPNAEKEFVQVGDYDLEICRTTPWYDAFREAFLQVQWPVDTEFLRHFLACVFVVSSFVDDPMAVFDKLTNEQLEMQTLLPPKPYPKWFSSNTYKYYVLLHDVSDGNQQKSETVYQTMKNTFGATNCHLLQINSRPQTNVESFLAEEGNNLPDPWAHFLAKSVIGSGGGVVGGTPNGFVDAKLDATLNHVGGGGGNGVGSGSEVDLSGLPTKVSEMNDTKAEGLSHGDSVVDLAVEMVEDPNDSIAEVNGRGGSGEREPSGVVNHPLSSPGQTDDEDDRMVSSGFGTLSGETLLIDSDVDSMHRSSSFLSTHGFDTNTIASNASTTTTTSATAHGLCLTVSDQDRIKIFVHEFCVRGLVPWVERTMRNLNEQVASKQGFLGRIQGRGKWGLFGNRTATPTANASSSYRQTTAGLLQCPYAPEGPELQLRRLGDIGFMFQNYELAFKHYYASKRDFQADQAWPFYAGALEMAAISNFMLHQLNVGSASRQPYPTRYMEQAINTYLSTCKMPLLATRAAIISIEALKCQKYYNDAAMQLIKMTSEDSDLRSAILLEQAAHCFINLKMARKYAFHMILAGHRFSKASQRRHALRCYDSALRVYRDRNWSLAEDHIQFTIGRQSFNLKNLKDSAFAFKQLLTDQSSQTPQQMASFLKEYLFVFKQLLDNGEAVDSTAGETQLHLPFIRQDETKVMLGYPTTRAYASPPGDASGEEDELLSAAVLFGNASAIDFSELSTDKREMDEWSRLEEVSVRAANGGKLPPYMAIGFKPQIRFMSKKSLNNVKPLTVVDEPIAFEIQTMNPLKVPLVLCDLVLKWKFEPLDGEEDAPDDGALPVEAETLPEFILSPDATQSIVLKLIPRRRGSLNVVGISYSLGSTSQSQIAAAVAAAGGVSLAAPGSPNSASKRGYASIAIKGTQPLTCRGPRLNNTKAEKTSVIHGVDKRLTLDVIQKQPCLSIKFHSPSSSRQQQQSPFPETLFAGQVQKVVVELKNKGSVAARSVSAVCNHPDVVVFGERTFASRLEAEQPVVDAANASSAPFVVVPDDHDNKPSNNNNSNNKSDHRDKYQLQEIFHSDEILSPNETAFIPLWIRGPDKPGEYALKIVFYYEAPPEARHAKLNYRVLYHKSMLISRPALHLVAVASKGHWAENEGDIQRPSTMTSTTTERKKSEMISVDLEIHNVAGHSRHSSTTSPQQDPTVVGGFEPTAVEFQLTRARCVSRRLRLVGDSDEGDSNAAARLKLNVGEHLFFTLTGEKTSPSEELRETIVSFADGGNESALLDAETDFPSSRFALRSKRLNGASKEERDNAETSSSSSSSLESSKYTMRVKNLDNVAECKRLDSVLILAWSANVLDGMGNTTVVVGQHHVCLNELDDFVRQKPSSTSSIPGGGSTTTQESVSHLSVKPPVVFPPVNHHVRRKRDLPTAADTLKPGCLGQLVSVSLTYPHQVISHDFRKTRLCLIRVLVSVANNSATEVGFALETGGVGGMGVVQSVATSAGSKPGVDATSNASPAPVAPFSWSGPMVLHRRLAAGAESRLSLTACIDRAGLYNLSAFKVRAAPMWMIEEEEGRKNEDSFADCASLTFQKCNPVRTVIVVDERLSSLVSDVG